jgi:mRNA-degrading endonuclease RelE of RelBE toxin-antitoxin system
MVGLLMPSALGFGDWPMTFEIEFSEDSERHLTALLSRDRKTLLDAIETQLSHEPTQPTRHRKLLRPNPLAAWELRVGDFRVFYNVEEQRILVIVVAVGRKEHNELTIDGKVIPL